MTIIAPEALAAGLKSLIECQTQTLAQESGSACSIERTAKIAQRLPLVSYSLSGVVGTSIIGLNDCFSAVR
jgi:hypothetical protein